MTETRPRVRALDGLALATTIALAVAGVAALATAVPLFLRASAIDALAADPHRFADVVSADDWVGTMFGVNALVTIGTGIVFIAWQYRHATNAEELHGDRLPLGPGWAIGGWFIPFANFVLPFLQLRQAIRATGRSVPGVVTLWTVLFAAGAVLFTGSVGLRGSERNGYLRVTDTLAVRDVSLADRAGGTAMLVYTAAAVSAIMVVRRLTAHQRPTDTP